jgi:hypothetical protein
MICRWGGRQNCCDLAATLCNGPVPPAGLAIMRRIDELHLDHPFPPSRILRDRLGSMRFIAGEHVQTGRRAQDLSVSAARSGEGRANQVWTMDIACIPMAHAFVYLGAVMDWFDRRCSRGGCRSHWRWTSALKQLRTRRPGTVDRRNIPLTVLLDTEQIAVRQ